MSQEWDGNGLVCYQLLFNLGQNKGANLLTVILKTDK